MMKCSFLKAKTKMIPNAFISVIIHKVDGRVNDGIEEYAAGMKTNMDFSKVSLDTVDARSVYRRMYDQETIDNERAAKVLERYARK